MSIPLEVLAAKVLGLPPEERSELLDRLLASLEPDPVDPAWEQAWSQEVDLREAEIDMRRAAWIPGEEAVARLRARLK
jgi:putative addiction module component (TIGR02574 family)